MNKSTRLLKLMQTLRGHRKAVTAERLAERMGVSVRTVYRDIQALVELGASIEGSAGVGYMLRSGFFLPPLMFSDDEIEALVLGARWVQGQGDADLAGAADSALVKIATASPRDLRERIAEIGLWAPRPAVNPRVSPVLGAVREAIRTERKLLLDYEDGTQRASERVIWPIVLAFFEGARVVAAWCELRGDFRHFRVDRIRAAQSQDAHYPTSRRELVKAWRATMRHTRRPPRAPGDAPVDTPARTRS